MSTEDAPSPGPASRASLARDLALYTGARLLLVVALAAAVLGLASLAGVQVPLVVAVLLALVLALPLSRLALGGLRRRVDRAVAEVGAARRAEREGLRARLRGDEDAPPAEQQRPEQ